MSRWMTMLLGMTIAACDTPPPGPQDQDRDGQLGGVGDGAIRRDADGTTTRPGEGTAATNDNPLHDRAVGDRGYLPPIDPTAAQRRDAEHLVAAVVGTEEHPNLRGAVHFQRAGDRIEVRTDVKGLPAGAHGYHVHLYGDCSNPGADSMGPHLDFAALDRTAGMSPSGTAGAGAAATTGTPSPGMGVAPTGRDHASATTPAGTASNDPSGTVPPAGTSGGADHGGMVHSAIAGNLGELTAEGRDGAVTANVTVSLSSRSLGMLNGRAVVIHENGNDENQPPDGAAGKPIACGVIGVANDRTSMGNPAQVMPGTPAR